MKLNSSNVTVSPVDPEKIWAKLVDFSSYSFNKSHSVAYAFVAYQTAKIWAYHQAEFLEMQLNYGGGDKYDAAVDKLKELGYKSHFPTYDNMKGDLVRIEGKDVFLAGGATENYKSVIHMITSDTWTGQLVLKGVCDMISRDREALLELFSSILKAGRTKLEWAEDPDKAPIKTLNKLLEAMLMSECITKYEHKVDENGTPTGNINVWVKKSRNYPDKLVVIHNDYSAEVAQQVIKYDKKFFGVVRGGAISDKPELTGYPTKFGERLSRFRNNQMNMNGWKIGDRPLNYKLKDELQKMLYEANIDLRLKTPENKYYYAGLKVIVADVRRFENQSKVTVKFNKGSDFYYIDNSEIDKLGKIKKNEMMLIDLMYSPFIKFKTSEFVEDFDIIKMRRAQ